VRNSLKFIGKSASLISATTLLMATTAIIPAEAANKAGARCTKVNAKAKIGGDSYVCTKNPTVKNAKLTWVWAGCIASHKLYVDANNRLKTITESAAQASTMLDTEIAALKAEAPADEARLRPSRQKLLPMKLKQKSLIRKLLMQKQSKQQHWPKQKLLQIMPLRLAPQLLQVRLTQLLHQHGPRLHVATN